MTFPNSKILAKILEIMQEVHEVEKRGKNKHHDYSYIRATDLLKMVREAFIKRQMVMITSVTSVTSWEGGTKAGHGVTLHMNHALYDLESGEMIQFHSAGEGADSTDKSIYKAYTGGLKYALRTLLMVPDKDGDPEHDKHEEEEDDDSPSPAEAAAATADRVQRATDGLELPAADRIKLFQIAQAADPELSEEGVTLLISTKVKALGLKSTKELSRAQFDKLCDDLSGQKPKRGKK